MQELNSLKNKVLYPKIQVTDPFNMSFGAIITLALLPFLTFSILVEADEVTSDTTLNQAINLTYQMYKGKAERTTFNWVNDKGEPLKSSPPRISY